MGISKISAIYAIYVLTVHQGDVFSTRGEEGWILPKNTSTVYKNFKFCRPINQDL